MKITKRSVLCTGRRGAVVATLLVVANAALADGKSLSAPPNETFKNECGSCHIAYPPKLLTAPAWRRVMSGLASHFGTDASLDAPAAKEIGAYLEANAGSGRRASDTPRITESPWFRRKHDEVSAAVWRRPAIKSAANCGACHADADRGDFRERNVRIPR